MGGGVAAEARALELAYRYLGRRERTVAELRRHLLGRGLDEAAVGAVVDELTEQGYVDDARYARMFTQDKRELEHWGSGRIRHVLLARGIDRDVVEAALRDGAGTEAGANRERASTSGDELERAIALLERRFADPPRERREQQRALGLLVRRGYEPELAMRAVAAHSRGRG